MTATQVSKPSPYRRLLQQAPVAAAAAALVNALLYYLGGALGAFGPAVQVRGEPFSVWPVLTLSLFSVLAAALVFAALVRFTARPRRIFWVVAGVVFALMFLTPFTIPGAPVVTIVVLELMHVVAAAAALWLVRRD